MRAPIKSKDKVEMSIGRWRESRSIDFERKYYRVSEVIK